MIMRGNGEGSIFRATNKDTIHLSMQLSHSTVKCIQNNCTPTARLPPLSEGYLSSEGLELSAYDEYHVHRQEQRQVQDLPEKPLICE